MRTWRPQNGAEGKRLFHGNSVIWFPKDNGHLLKGLLPSYNIGSNSERLLERLRLLFFFTFT